MAMPCAVQDSEAAGLMSSFHEEEEAVPRSPNAPSQRFTKRTSLAVAGVMLMVLFGTALVWHREEVPNSTSDIAALTELYMPAVHAQAAREAFTAAYDAKSSNLKRLMADSDNVASKITAGTCHRFGCKASRGPTDCLLSQCICKYGYGTVDGETCVPIAQIVVPPKAGLRMTAGTCRWGSCKSSRGPTDCISRKCVCKAGFYAPDGQTCVSTDDTVKVSAMATIMLQAGIVEPDELPCPGSTVEMGSQGALMLMGTRKYEVSLCRLSIQIYHGSPLPLVTRSQLKLTPSDNGDMSANNIGVKEDLYSLDTNRQWRTSMIQLMSKQFMYAVVTPNVAEGARRLGNIFHTLTDTWSASHVARNGPRTDDTRVVADESVCSQFYVGTAISMDSVNWAVHSKADSVEDLLYRCARFFTQKGIDLWAEVRANPITNAGGANWAIDRFIHEVLCPSLPVKSEDLDKPAGGATSELSSDFKSHKPVLPKGTSDMDDTTRLIAEWDAALGKAKSSADDKKDASRFGKNIFISSRLTDACFWTPAAHVNDAFVHEAIYGSEADNYLMPAPALQLGEKLKRQTEASAKSVELPSIHEDKKDNYQ